MTRVHQAVTLDMAEGLAAQGLAFIAESETRLFRFLALTGITPERIREQAETPQFLASVLEYLAADESLLLTFSANSSVAPETIAPALALLRQACRGAARL